MKTIENVRANLEVITKPLLLRDEFFTALSPHRREPYIDEEMNF